MPWLKIDDGFTEHPKFNSCRDYDLSVAVMVQLMCYSARNLTDGVIPARILHRHNSAVVSDLIEAGFLEMASTEGTYRIHDYLDYNPSREEALLLKEKRRLAGSSGGKRSGDMRYPWWNEMVDLFGACVRCGTKNSPLTRDHIIPRYQGGTHGPDNIQPLCRPCNSSKGPDTTDYRLAFAVENGLLIPQEWLTPNSKQMLEQMLEQTGSKRPSRIQPRTRTRSLTQTRKETSSCRDAQMRNIPENVLGYWIGKMDREPNEAEARSLRNLCKRFKSDIVALAIGQAVTQGEAPTNFALITTIAKRESE